MPNTQFVSSKHEYRPLEELNLLDDFLFQEVLAQKGDGEEFCRILLSTILERPIRKVRIVPQKNVLGIDTNKHGIRMDAYIEDISDEECMPGTNTADAEVFPDVYDFEPNKTFEKTTLPKRMRYYHGLIDTQLLSTGVKYSNLQNVVIIVILPYDPFGKNRMVYTIQNQCVEDSQVQYDDGAKKIFLYTKGTEGNPRQELKDMLKYLEMTNDENVTNQNIDTIHHFVNKVKHRKEVNTSYMKSWEIIEMHREEGKAEGINYGIEALITTCQELQHSFEETQSKVMEKFRLTEKSATEYMQQYWK